MINMNSHYNSNNTSPLTVTTILSLSTLTIVQLFTPADPLGRTTRFLRQLRGQEKGNLSSSSNVVTSVSQYERLHSPQTSTTERVSQYTSLVNSYYDLATLFYEWGWGSSFHFSNRHPHETFDEATRRHEFYLASKLNLGGVLGRIVSGARSTMITMNGSNGHNAMRNGRNTNGGNDITSIGRITNGPTMANVKVLDVGCGIGGPMRNICKFTGADVTGLTLNQYQVDRGNELCRADAHFYNGPGTKEEIRCRSVQGDFMKQPFDDSSFDAAYAIEATCHAPNRLGCYSEIYRVLKPGSIFACYEWCLTDKYDPENPEHVYIKKQIEEGDGLPDIVSKQHCLKALEEAGFEILEERDLVLDDYGGWQDPKTGEYSLSKEAKEHNRGGKPWMLPLMPSWNPLTQRFQFNWLGRRLTKFSLKILEFLRLAPEGTARTQIMLENAVVGLVRGGELGIFTPMYMMVGRVPLNK